LHIIQLEEKRPAKTLEEVRAEIAEALASEQARKLAWEAADRFSYEVFDLVETTEGIAPAVVFGSFAEQREKSYLDTTWFDDTTPVAPFGYSRAALRDAYRLSQSQPVSDVLEGIDKYFVACLIDQRPGYLPELTGGSETAQKVAEEIRRELALEAARAEARRIRDQIAAELAKGLVVDNAIVTQYEFEEVPEFSLGNPPYRVRNARLLVDLVPQYAAGTLAESSDTDDGAVLFYIADRKLPSPEEIAENREQTRTQVEQRKQQAVLEEFYQRLDEESNTQIEDGKLRQAF
jgi:hypothetical protein